MVSLAGALARNWILKLSAFGLALLLWVAVRVEAPTLDEISGIPVRVALADARWSLVDAPVPATVTVRLEGPSRELMRIMMDRPPITIPLEAIASADTVVILNPAWFPVGGRQGVRIDDFLPSSIRISFEPIERRNLPTALRFEGDLPDTLALAGPPMTDPSEIRVSGPRSRLEVLESIPLLPIDLTQVAGSGTVAAAVDTSSLDGLTVLPAQLLVTLRVEPKVTGSVSEVPIRLPGGLAGAGYAIRFSTATAILQGARSQVESIDPSALAFVVDTTGIALPEPGAEAEFPLHIEGLPPLLTGEARPAGVVIRNVAEVAP